MAVGIVHSTALHAAKVPKHTLLVYLQQLRLGVWVSVEQLLYHHEDTDPVVRTKMHLNKGQSLYQGRHEVVCELSPLNEDNIYGLQEDKEILK